MGGVRRSGRMHVRLQWAWALWLDAGSSLS
jgi:hypothetical protein